MTAGMPLRACRSVFAGVEAASGGLPPGAAAPGGEPRQGHLVDALALRGEEGRGTLRKAAGRGARSAIRRFPNGATPPRERGSPPEPIGRRGEPGELKHLSSRRKGHQPRLRQ